MHPLADGEPEMGESGEPRRCQHFPIVTFTALKGNERYKHY